MNEPDNFYTLKELAGVIKKSRALLYKRLTENPRRWGIRFAHKEGGTWLFDRLQVDRALRERKSVLYRLPVRAGQL